MKNITTIVLLILAVTLNTKAQQNSHTIEYVYDANGNRLECLVVNLQRTSALQSNNTTDYNDTEKIDYKDVVLYPNPTKGILTIELPNSINGTPYYNRFLLHASSGVMVMHGEIYTTPFTLDITKEADGIYILSLMGENSKRTTIKVIKQ
ncbi:MAG: T9SS type A sorting domain-containing protein [Bacteroidales bacterium]|nr:T9SS type A sorting domain-containing protein [Bacteroidales bacterium]MBN2750100.1 T9SS type A sorting domain-containing protein [Bacteroidales bacterium]